MMWQSGLRIPATLVKANLGSVFSSDSAKDIVKNIGDQTWEFVLS